MLWILASVLPIILCIIYIFTMKRQDEKRCMGVSKQIELAQKSDVQTQKIKDKIKKRKIYDLVTKNDIIDAMKKIKCKLTFITSRNYNFHVPSEAKVEELKKKKELIDNLNVFNEEALEELEENNQFIPIIKSLDNDIAQSKEMTKLFNEIDIMSNTVQNYSNVLRMKGILIEIKELERRLKTIKNHDDILKGVNKINNFIEKWEHFPKDINPEEIIQFKKKLELLENLQKKNEEINAKIEMYVGINNKINNILSQFTDLHSDAFNKLYSTYMQDKSLQDIKEIKENEWFNHFKQKKNNSLHFKQKFCLSPEICINNNLIKQIKSRGYIQGMFFQIFPGVFKDSTFQLTPVEEGKTDDFSNLSKASNGSITKEEKENDFAIEWNGFFRPKETGIHTFTFVCQGLMMLYIGDEANDAQIDNFTMKTNSPSKSKSESMKLLLQSSSQYSICIRYGTLKNQTKLDFSFSYKGPGDKAAKSKNDDGTFDHILIPRKDLNKFL